MASDGNTPSRLTPERVQVGSVGVKLLVSEVQAQASSAVLGVRNRL